MRLERVWLKKKIDDPESDYEEAVSITAERP